MLQTAKHVYKMLERREQDIATILTSGGIQDMENYRLLVGEMQGLNYAKGEMKSLLEKNYEDGEDIISTRPYTSEKKKDKAYVKKEERVLDPTLLTKHLKKDCLNQLVGGF